MHANLKSATSMLGAVALGVGAVVVASAPASASTLQPGCTQNTNTVTCTYVSGGHPFTVPDGVTSLFVDAIGGDGGAAAGGGVGGDAADVSGFMAVTPGSTFYALVGGDGVVGAGGVNGGGDPGPDVSGSCAGGGGGASDIRTDLGDPASRRLVAAGGGGAGCASSTGATADGGAAGAVGSSASSPDAALSGGPGGAGSVHGSGAGGTGGTNGLPGSPDGAPGLPGQWATGGTGGSGITNGGGGGAGYYGGGGGGGGIDDGSGFPTYGSGGGGGGGGSYADPAYLSDVSESPGSMAQPQVTITYQASGAATVSPTSLTFGPYVVGAGSRSQSVTFSASGGPVDVSDVAINGSDAGDFVITTDTCAGSTVPDGGSCTVAVVFDPTAEGSRTATLDFTSDASNGTQSVPLSGTADPHDGQLDIRGPGTVYTDGDGHTVSLGVSAGNGASYWLKVLNIGHVPAQFLVSTVVNPRGVTGAYANPAHIDMYSGEMGLTALPAASTYYTPVIPAGGTQTYRMQVTPNSTDPQGISPIDVTLTRLDGALLARAHTQTNVAAGNNGTTSWDVFVANGSQPAIGGSFSGQKITAPTLTTSSSSSASWSVKLRNDGRTSGPIGLHLHGSCDGFPIKVTAPSGFSGVDVTAQVLAGTYYTPTLPPGGATTLTVKATWDQASSCTSEAFSATTLDTAGNPQVAAYLQANLIAS